MQRLSLLRCMLTNLKHASSDWCMGAGNACWVKVECMKSGKQRKAEIQLQRAGKAARAAASAAAQAVAPPALTAAMAACNPLQLAAYNSYGQPDFVARGYYVDEPFCCKDCGKQEVWTATRQKWWYEVAKGQVFTRANRCNACRRKERERAAEARRVQQQGKRQSEKEGVS